MKSTLPLLLVLAFALTASPGSAAEPEPGPEDSPTDEAPEQADVFSVTTPDERLPGDFWVGYRPEFGLIGMTAPVMLHRAEIGGGGRLGALRVWGFADLGILHGFSPLAHEDGAEDEPAVTLEGGLIVAGAKGMKKGEFFAGPRFSFGGMDFDLTFASLGAATGFIWGRWDRKTWFRLGLDVVVVFPWRLPEYTTLGIALSASVLVR
jgi:hypothetical protein